MKKFLRISFLILIVACVSCENESLGEMKINRDIVDEELFVLMERIATPNEESIECIDFNYSFPLFVFDENLEYLEVILITEDAQFSEFLLNLPENNSISLSYPISGTLSNGDLLEINNNEELAQAIDGCLKEEYQGICNNALASCVWEVRNLNGYPNPFVGDYFYLEANEIVQFHTADEIYFGTWTTFYIGDDLHLNMYINTDGEIADTWNLDWNIASFSEDSIELESSNNRSLIEKDCSIDCSVGSYEACEIATNPGFAEFSFQEYARCIPMPFSHDLASPVRVTYYETEADAIDGINPISHTEYTNLTNPQMIYIRIEYLDTAEVLGFWEILIEAISC